MNKGKLVIAFFSGILGLGVASAAFAQSSNSNPIVLQPGSGNQKIQRGDDGMQGNGGMAGGEHEGMGNGHSGGMNGSGGMGGSGSSGEGGGEGGEMGG